MELKQVLDTIQAVQLQNDHLQAQVEYLNQIRDLRRGQRVDAEDVVDFKPFAPMVAAVEIPEHLETLTLDMYSGDSNPIDHLLLSHYAISIQERRCNLSKTDGKGFR